MIGSFGSSEFGSNEFLLPYSVSVVAKTIKGRICEVLKLDAMSGNSGKMGSLLGHFDSAPYGVFFLSPPQRPDFPLITYHAISEAGRMPRDVLVNIAVWGGDIRAIHGRIHRLLDGAKLDEIIGGRALTCKWNWAGPDLFDEDLRTCVRVERYLVKEAKN